MQMTLTVVKHSRWMRQTIFITILCLNLAGYMAMRFWFPLAPQHRQVPLSDIRSFTPSLAKGVSYGFLFLAMYALYLLAYFLVRRLRVRPQLWLILGATILFSLPLLQTYPINSTDLFRYFIRGRMTSLYGENVYTTTPATISDDPFTAMAGEWANDTSPYGPVWEMVAAGITAVSPYNLYLGTMALKSLGLLAFLGSGLLIWQMLANTNPGKRSSFTLLWAWNPALLAIFVLNAHNDALMIFWLILGFWFMRRGKLTIGFLVMIIATLTKPVALLALPIFFLACLCDLGSWWARVRFGMMTAVGSAILIMLAFLPFGSPLNLTMRLLKESTEFPGFSFMTLPLLRLNEQGIVLTYENLENFAAFGHIFLVGLMAWLAWKTWHGRAALRGVADIFWGYLFQALSFRIWYAAWPFPWLLLDEADKKGDGRLSYRLRFGLCFLLTSQLSVFIYGHLHEYYFDSENYATHLVGVPFTFVLPFLLAALPEIQQLIQAGKRHIARA